jgi:hypothetical protein
MAVVDVGNMTATWTDPFGVEWPLTDDSPDGVGFFTTTGPAGWHATTYEIVTDPVPRGGESVRFIRAQPCRIVWPLYVGGDTHLQWLQRHRQIRKAFLSTLHRGIPGTLKISRPDDTAREIDCFYESGFEGQAGEGRLFSKDAITLYAPDGYWRDLNVISISRSYVPGVNFLSPFPQVSDSLTLGETTLNNPGDVDAWPFWTITGPMTALTATNITTGQEFTLTYALNPGEQITIATQQPAVRGPSGQNLTYALDWPDAFLWSMSPGDNDVIMNVSGGASGTTLVLAFRPRYEGA